MVPGKLGNKLLISVRLFPTQLVIEVNYADDDSQLRSQLQQNPQQRNRINAARYRHTHSVACSDQFFTPDMIENSLGNSRHGNMLHPQTLKGGLSVASHTQAASFLV